ncbi:P-loop containing nucleoside triphosphate hydrolase protein [Bombardia bombarda]|uniref:Kinesin-like protein n=1 Tax=Bombardia bombarda TaxID=252184 RepID=A0AA39XLR2_9PEZI|nr:P-loop containing nucleoside triphosphate hydrolase protein [Bombardia bombarda]
MERSENTTVRTGIRPPTNYSTGATAPTAALQEMTDSQSNARAQPTTMPPPQGVKRLAQGGQLPQPEPKLRKTLADRAGEYGPSNKSHLPSAMATPAPTRALYKNAQSLVATSLLLPPGTIASSRHTSNFSQAPRNAFATSIGPGSRPPVSSMNRPSSSIGFSQSTTTRPRGATRSRPPTITTDQGTNSEGGQGTQQPNGTKPSLALRTRKLRGTASMQSLSCQAKPQGKQEKSDILGLSKQLRDLSLRDEDIFGNPKGDQVIPKQDGQSLLPPPQLDAELDHVVQQKCQKEEASSTPFSSPGSSQSKPVPWPPKTPSRTRDPEAALQQLNTLEATVKDFLNTPVSPVKPSSPVKQSFLTKHTNLRNFTGWDVDERLQTLDSQFKAMKEVMDSSITDKKTLEDAVELAKTRVDDLERERLRLDEKNRILESDLKASQAQVTSLTVALETEKRAHKYAVEDTSRAHRLELDELRRELKDETDRLQRSHREALEALERHCRAELEDERSQKSKEIQEVRAKLGSEQQDMNLALLGKDREIQGIQSQLEAAKLNLDREHTIKGTLQQQIGEMSTTNLGLEDRMRALRAQIDFLESDSKQQSDSFEEMRSRLEEAQRSEEEARQKLIHEETERRLLFNKYQELKGNIRVMCRVRPVLDPSEGDEAKILFPDLKTSTQIDVTGPEEKSSLGNVNRKVVPFEFDRVFSPSIHNEEIFGEISQLVQSALDGYNVCIFCYGQTGSGKTYTMSSTDGMIPRATHMIYDSINKLKEKSWTYTMEGSFVEVYNEELNDLLTPAKDAEGKKKLEIRHDDTRKQTAVLNCKSVILDSANKVESMLQQAQNNRSVAATKANERSSRSHSVFILKLVGENAATSERCEGTLNLVDLAGSERLKHSGAEGDRMKETQSINKSLACLGDVIEALGRGSAHIPYRNSKLTHLLQYSLGGNSKTLMFVMVSPLEAHLKETLTSLRFATKVSWDYFTIQTRARRLMI